MSGRGLWRLWHAALLGSGVVAYLTADEDTYRMHQAAGYLFVVLILGRLIAALAGSGAFALRRPARLSAQGRPGVRASLRPLLPWMTAGLLLVLGLAGLSGVGADWSKAFKGVHEILGEVTPWVVFAHVVLVVAVFAGPLAGRKARRRPMGGGSRVLPGLCLAAALATGLASGLAASRPAWAGPPQDAVLAVLAERARAAEGAFAGFDSRRGEALYRALSTNDPELTSCAACHGVDPRAAGRHVKSGRAIEPVAVSANPERFGDIAKVDKRFTRDCKAVLGRACTALEQGDYARFLIER
ncbi:hypothetical protein F11_16310 [Rhodospirillum rubrum F11]|uniref:Cytochrome c domain-containing protein n=3 Tax=Rhodospirillum rubrum TaxID=1085 RepID=Q2RPG6_RHORT|nr:DUF1924 domain-containing protein [Rhodospirillum rubrum]ABC23979.1 hypothetical protein Rru_A3184 [Rhodospirillum rubrum ATCC 11170]AEO49724.1 hypothetical protein F11_16310 [Rhodospirillum rubrum F11]MBK5955663.1 hypothetical protein [Rhodospirillum rubrum]QXG79922.1 DUF1924 domain-containing protein [Rhodospirillum rubrum]HAP99257.1 DUF1924 domain-containing protein [Rhodospirillum rubrum]